MDTIRIIKIIVSQQHSKGGDISYCS